MTETANEQSTMEQAKERAQDMKGQAGERLREQVDTRSTQAGEQVGSIAGTLRKTAEQLRQEGQEPHAKILEQGADRAEQLGGYLRNMDGDSLLRDAEGLGRRKPWAMAAGAAAVGFVASRFLRASSQRRYQSSGVDGAYGGDSFGEPYRRVPSPGVAAYEDTGAGEAWRGPDADLGDQLRRSTTTGQPS